MMKPWHEMKCSLHIFRELVPAKCQNLFGKLESQSTGELTGENFNYIQFREGTIFWYTAYLKKIQNFLLKMLWFGSSHFTKAVLSPQLVPFTFSFGPGRRVGCRPQWVITDYAVVPSVPGDLLPLGYQQNAEALTSCAEHVLSHRQIHVRHLHWADGNHEQLPVVCPAAPPATAAAYLDTGMPTSYGT